MPTKAEVRDMISKLESGEPISNNDEIALIAMLSELLATLESDSEAK